MKCNLLRQITFDLIRHVEPAPPARDVDLLLLLFRFISSGPMLSDVGLFSGSLTANVLIFFTAGEQQATLMLSADAPRYFLTLYD